MAQAPVGPVRSLARALMTLTRPSRGANRRRARRRGERPEAFLIREVGGADLNRLVDLHVRTWNATYPFYSPKPTHEIRRGQWSRAFAGEGPPWFCFVVEHPDGDLVGFAKGIHRPPEVIDGHEFRGELSKIYLLRRYQRLGLGRAMLGRVAERFLAEGIPSMVLFAEVTNPSSRFYEAMGAARLRDADGRLRGAYGWPDLRVLAVRAGRSS